ncbi:MAG: formyltransferase family protein [Kofleriaceae bacterium]
MKQLPRRGEWTDATDVTPLELRSDPPLEIYNAVPRAMGTQQSSPVKRPPQLATLLVGCREQQGLVAALAQLLESHGVRVQNADQHADHSAKLFFQRLRFDLSTLTTDRSSLEASVREIGERLGMEYRLYGDRRRRTAILVSKQDHCLYDLLVRHRSGELNCDIAAIISNHPDAAPIAKHFEIPFHHLPVTKERKHLQEAQVIDLLYQYGVELVVLARYMQILSPEFVERFPTRIIGATSHYVTAELDLGPIIEQETDRCSHRDTVEDLVRKGRDLEKRVLAAALRYHLEDRIMVYSGKTVVFD